MPVHRSDEESARGSRGTGERALRQATMIGDAVRSYTVQGTGCESRRSNSWATRMDNRGLEHHTVAAKGLNLHVLEGGAGPPVVLLHGFPDFWYGWRLQIPALVEAGYRVIAPDLPGYNESEGPRDRRGYTTAALADTLAALIEAAAGEKVVLVGHDWGGVLAWRLAAGRPDLVRRLVIMNAPHPRVFARLLLTTSQLRKSWYAFFFQLPWLPERLLAGAHLAVLERVWRRGVRRREAVTDEDVARYRRAFERPGALTAALAYYRRAWRLPLKGASGGGTGRVDVPTLVIWGERDPHLDVRNLDGLEEWVPDLTVERIPEAAHWVQLDSPDEVNGLLVSFGRPGDGRRGAGT